MKQIDMETLYATMNPEAIPWDMSEPPEALVDLVEGGRVTPCRTVEFGCGTGTSVVYLASKGFRVTGIDISPTAIRIAREKADKKGVTADFLVADVLGDVGWIRNSCRFAYDWELLHHIMPDEREQYVANVHAVLGPGGKYLSVCFSESDPQFGGQGKYRRTPIGTLLYFSSEEELAELFSPRFTIIDLETRTIAGRYAPHLAVYAFMEKR
ncbi:MAG TPA: class I SAM-dependent methyltransferase [Methanoculleus sp.]|nr:class I SAM-dependent methyltransferase [Methanoculleus sp.]